MDSLHEIAGYWVEIEGESLHADPDRSRLAHIDSRGYQTTICFSHGRPKSLIGICLGLWIPRFEATDYYSAIKAMGLDLQNKIPVYERNVFGSFLENPHSLLN